MDKRAAGGDDDKHHRGKLVNKEADRHLECARGDPGVEVLIEGLAVKHIQRAS